MAQFTPRKIEIKNINKGNRFNPNDGISAEAVNAPIEAALLAQNIATNQPVYEENGGEPTVSILDTETAPKLKFENLRQDLSNYQTKSEALEQISALKTEIVSDLENTKTELQKTTENVADNNREIENIYTILGETVTGTEEVSQAYSVRQTAGGLSIIDGALTRVEKVQGATVATDSGLKNAYFEGIKSTGKNLIPYPYSETTKTMNGITFTDNGDGSITVNGTATVSAYFFLAKGSRIKLIAGQYTISGYKTGVIVNAVKNGVWWGQNGTLTAEEGDTFGSIALYVESGVTVNNVTVYPMFQYGTTASDYEPYKETNLSLNSPIELGKWDYIDFENQKVVRGTGFDIFNGTENWRLQSVNDVGIYNYVIYTKPKTSAVHNSLCNMYEYDGNVIANATREGYTLATGGNVFIRTKSYTTADEWKAHLAELYASGKPLMIAYELATPTEEDIDISTDKYTVWNGGSETVIQGKTDNSADGAKPTITQTYVVKRGTSV